MKRYIIGLLLLFSPSFSQGAELTLRLGEGGMYEQRAPDNSLGGHQIATHLLLDDLPLGFSIAQESYTKGPDPEEPYEIKKLLIVNAYYVHHLKTRFTKSLQLGAGVGRLTIPHGDRATAYQLSALIDTPPAWRINGFAAVKYLYSKDGEIDFSDFAFFVGVGFKIGSW